ncbi:MAG: histidinol-phosphate transaminase [Gammaproteobacteria bacterium]|nr:histidinol-phosphate transaminase [Gammaproteobacteria bacterium]
MTSVLPLARPEIAALEPYSHAHWDPSLERLHANENPWRVAGDATTGGLNRYPEPQPHELVERLAGLYGVTPAQVLVGRGSDEGIDLLVRGFCRAGLDSVLTFPPTFGMYKVAARIQGAGVVEVPLRADDGYSLDVDAALAAWHPGVKLVFVCTPNNPTGNAVDPSAIERLLLELSGRSLVVVDEAYAEFTPAASLARRLAEFPNLAVLRTLSKAYALAGARIGTVLASAEIIGLLRRMIPPYALPVASIEAALAATTPVELQRACERVGVLIAERERLRQRMGALPLVVGVLPSDANFLLVRCRDAGRLLAAGVAAGLLVRDVRSQPGLGDCLRVSIGTPEQNERLLAAWESA